MAINNRTSSRNYAKPNVANLLSEDVVRLSEALDSIDTDVAALQSKAPLASPALTGTPSAPTPAVDTNTTQVATTAFVVGQASAANPVVDGTAAAGSSLRFARADHVHPIDTSRAPVASPTFTGTPAAPTPATDTNSTRLATTAFVIGQDYTKQTRTVFAGAGLTGGGDLSANRTISADVATQAEAEAGSSNAKLMTPQRTAQAIVASGPLAGFRNLVINGDFQVWQRGVTFGNANGYTADRWIASGTGTLCNVGQGGHPSGLGERKSFNIGAVAGNTRSFALQKIESQNIAPYANTQVTLSVNIYSASARTVNLIVDYANTADNFSSVTNIILHSVSVGAGTFDRYSHTFTLPSQAARGIQVVLGADTGITSGTVAFSMVQLEPGPVATPFEQRPIGTELALCQRYCCRTMLHAQSASAGSMVTPVYFPVEMRATPTTTNISAGSASNASVTQVNPSNTTSAYFQISVSVGGGSVVDRVNQFVAEL